MGCLPCCRSNDSDSLSGNLTESSGKTNCLENVQLSKNASTVAFSIFALAGAIAFGIGIKVRGLGSMYTLAPGAVFFFTSGSLAKTAIEKCCFEKPFEKLEEKRTQAIDLAEKLDKAIQAREEAEKTIMDLTPQYYALMEDLGKKIPDPKLVTNSSILYRNLHIHQH